MSNSRRIFLRTGLIAALFAVVPLKHAFGQSWKDRDGNPGETPPVQDDPLRNYSKATFISYLNSIFQLHTVNGTVEVTLLEVTDMQAPKDGECFTLLFRGGARSPRQDTYTLVHPALGTFQLLLVPAGTDQNGAQGYVATINRLSYYDAANMVAPTKGDGARQPSTKTTTTGTTGTSTTPNSTPNATPSAQPTSQPASPPAAPVLKKPQPSRGRKPSWKDLEESPILDNDWLNL